MKQLLILTILFCVTLIHIQPATANIYQEKLFPFGLEQGDMTLERSDDGISPSIHIPIRFPFFDRKYDEIKIQINGMILFGNQSYKSTNYTPAHFPLDKIICVAPFWADAITANDDTSNIFYRQISDESTLNELGRIIKNMFPARVIHRLVWAFIVTWYEVPGYQLPSGLCNTFQAIIATNGINSFSIFNYDKLQWTVGSASKSIHAQAGFNAGDLKNYFLIDKSFTPHVVELVNDSNAQFPGRFIFSIGEDITNVNCKTSDGLQMVPMRGSSYGGYEIRLYGICFNETNYQIKIDQTVLTDCMVTLMYVTCIMPLVYNGPTIPIEMLTMNNVLIGTTSFLIEIPDDNSELLIQDSNIRNSLSEMSQNDSIILQFRKNFVTNTYLFNVHLSYYETIFTRDYRLVNVVPRQRTLYSSVNLSTIETLNITYPHIFTLATNQNVHDPIQITLLHLTFTLLSVSTRVTSSLAWFYRAVHWTATVVKQTSLFCEKWKGKLPQMPLPSTYQAQIPRCPCRVPATGLNRFPLIFNNFRSDSSCNEHKVATCIYNKHASHCYRSSFEPVGPGVKCCYNSDGIIITNPELGAGGLELEANSGSSIIQQIKHAVVDQLPVLTCCEPPKTGQESCTKYHEQRPSFECETIPPPVPSGGNGDPHFTTFDGVDYTFNGYGEYVLLRTHTLLNSTSLEIQIRTKPIRSNSQTNQATAIVGFVISNSNYSKVQFELFQELKLLEIRLNDQTLDGNVFFNPIMIDTNDSETDRMLLTLSETVRLDNHQMSITQINQTTYSIVYSNNVQFIIKIREQYDFLNIMTILPTFYEGHCQGLLGNMDNDNNNEFIFQDNQTILSFDEHENEERLFAFGESWRVTPETTLFTYTAGENYHTQQNFHFRPIFREELFQRYEHTPRLTMAQQSCQKILSNIRNQQCIYDVLITNDSTMSDLHSHFQTNINEWKEYAILLKNDDMKSMGSMMTISNNMMFLVIMLKFIGLN